MARSNRKRRSSRSNVQEDVASPSIKKKELKELFQLCRNNKWMQVMTRVTEDPALALQSIPMENSITTSILHQAITSKGCIPQRENVISAILFTTPEASKIRNGYGSLPLHVICQRNTRMDSKTKDRLIRKMVNAFPGALVEPAGVGKRTPLHIIFTDYISAPLTEMMIHHGKLACFMKDKKGFSPAHVACSRHCSPEKLRMLLKVNPHALVETTNDGQSLIDLATSTATAAHPNHLLIAELKRQHQALADGVDTVDSKEPTEISSGFEPPVLGLDADSSGHDVSSLGSDSSPGEKRKRRVAKDPPAGVYFDDSSPEPVPSTKRFKIDVAVGTLLEEDPAAAALLLNFSRNTPPLHDNDGDGEPPIAFVEV